MNGIEFLAFAKTNYNSSEEAARRSAVSRAYYALYHDVRQNFRNMGLHVYRGPDEHRRLASCLSQSGIAAAMIVGQSMGDLRTARNDADYDLSTSCFNAITSALHCAKAESAINELAKMNKNALQAALRRIGDCR